MESFCIVGLVMGGPSVKAYVFSTRGEIPSVDKVIICPARKPCSGCELRGGDHCCWYKGDGFGYMIIGPDMDLKRSDGGYENI